MTQPEWLGGMKWRLLGPYRGGRVCVVAGHPTERMTFFFGGAGSGLWKTDDGGHLWKPIADDYLTSATVGALAISEAAPNRMYLGTGEGVPIPFHSGGDGVYRSTNSGKSWQHCGLRETQHISRLRVHPRNPDIVYAAALGHRFGPNPERGIYRSTDGGDTWQHILFRSDTAGAADIALDENNPRILYASFWDTMLQPWTHHSGGEGTALYRSYDGGDTWEEITQNPGIPDAPLGKMMLAASPVKPGRLWAMIEAEHGGIYRSEDYGDRWTWLSNERNFMVRPRYSFAIVPDPANADTVYVPGRKLWKSTDAGRTFGQLNVPYVDQHDLWVDPHDPQRMILGSDGGASVSLDGGRSWSTLVNQPTAEIYRITTDNRFPYRVYGSQQDNSTLAVPSRSDRGPLSQMEWYDIGGGESGYIAVRPDNPNIVYSSDLPGLGVTRYDHANFQIREIGPWGEPGNWETPTLKYRFNWCVPVKLSPHDPNILYVAGNVVFRSKNEGDSWEEISPDLTRRELTTMGPVGGPISREDSSAFQFPAISSVAESPFERGVLWVGTDDGLIHVSRDDGATWTNVTPPDMPEWALIRMEVSRFKAGKAYAAATNYRRDDFRPCLFKTEDYGQTWTSINKGIDDTHLTRIIREDVERPGLLFAGTEAGVYTSLDDGDSWFQLKFNLPTCVVYDLCVKEGDVLIATHGRSMWSLDDITPLRQLRDEVIQKPVHLFEPRPVIRVTRQIYGLNSLNTLYFSYAANNPASGVVVDYYFADAPEGEVRLQLLDSKGTRLQHFTSERPPRGKPNPIGALAYRLAGGARLVGTVAGEEEMGLKWGALTLGDKEFAPVPKEKGLNRFVLPIRAPDAYKLPGLLSAGITSPALPPGEYTIRLTVGEVVYETAVHIHKDPRVTTTHAEYQAQYALMLKIRDRVTTIHRASRNLQGVRDQLEERLRVLAHVREAAPVREMANVLIHRLTEIEHELIQPNLNEKSGELDGIHFPDKLDAKLETLGYQVARSDNAPTRQAYALFTELDEQVETQLRRLDEVLNHDAMIFNELAQRHRFPIIMTEV